MAHRDSKPGGGSQSLKTHQGGLQSILDTLVTHRDSQTPQGGSQRLLDISKSVRHLKVAQGIFQDTLWWLTEALRHLRVAHTGSQILHGGSEALRHLMAAHRVPQIELKCLK